MNTAVVIPTYNRAAMVVQAAESALGQSAACRVVVVDDGSTDGTQDVLAPLERSILYLRQDNRERGAARNAGAARVPEAKLLVFLDADDVLEREHVAILQNLASSRPDAPLVTTGAWVCDQHLERVQPYGRTPPGPVTLDSFLLGKRALPMGASGVRRTAFAAANGFPERRDLSGSEDWLFAARVLSVGTGWGAEERSLRIRRHPGNTMGEVGGMHRTMLLAHGLWFHEEAPRRAPQSLRLERASRARLLVQSAAAHYGVGRTREARRILREAVRADPRVLGEPLAPWIYLRSLLGPEASSVLRDLKQDLLRRLRKREP